MSQRCSPSELTALYNEIEPYAADWMENLVKAGHIAPGRVDRRSIVDLQPADVAGPGQRHFFAGIGVWSAALRLAGWPDDADVWTGSPPCQPWSVAGRRKGIGDARHLWPEWFRLIRECRPSVIFIEQVASADGLKWLDSVFADLEGTGYACAAADLPAACCGAPHIRQRLYSVAYANDGKCGSEWCARIARGGRDESGRGVIADVLAYANGARLEVLGQSQGDQELETVERGVAARELADTRQEQRHRAGRARDGWCEPADRGDVGHLANTRGERLSWVGLQLQEREPGRGVFEIAGGGPPGLLGNSGRPRGRGDTGAVPSAQDQGEGGWGSVRRVVDVPGAAGATRGFWAAADWLACTDGRARPVEPRSFPLAHGSASRVGPGGAVETQPRTAQIKGYGNAIVRPLAATFIRAFMEATGII